MMVLKRKEIIATALVVLIGMAGYLNWSYQDTIRVKDGESYIETGKKISDAKPVNADAELIPEDQQTKLSPEASPEAAETSVFSDIFTSSIMLFMFSSIIAKSFHHKNILYLL